MSSSKKIDLKRDFAAGVYQILYSGDTYSQSCWYFRPSFVNFCPSNLLSGSPLQLYISWCCTFNYFVSFTASLYPLVFPHPFWSTSIFRAGICKPTF